MEPPRNPQQNQRNRNRNQRRNGNQGGPPANRNQGEANRPPNQNVNRNNRQQQVPRPPPQNNRVPVQPRAPPPVSTIDYELRTQLRQLRDRQLVEADLTLTKPIFTKLDFDESDGDMLGDLGLLITHILALPRPLLRQFVHQIYETELLFRPGMFPAVLRSLGPKIEPAKAANTIPFLEAVLKMLEEIIQIFPESSPKINIEALAAFRDTFEKNLAHSPLSMAVSVEERQLAFKAEQLVGTLQQLLGKVNTQGRHREQNFNPAPVAAPKRVPQADPKLDEMAEYRFAAPREGHFRAMELEVTAETLTVNTQQCLRRIRLHTPFADLEEYLDVQFRLLWEDFFSNIKVGLRMYQEIIRDANKKINIEDLKFHKGWIGGVVAAKGFLCLRLTLEIGYTKMLNPRRFTEGGMLIVSRSDFEEFFSFVIRDKKLVQLEDLGVKKSLVTLLVEAVSSPNLIGFWAETYQGWDLKVAEPSQYYEGVVHCLRQLQRMRRIPLEDIIVHGKVNAVDYPFYLCSVGPDDYRRINSNQNVVRTLNRSTQLAIAAAKASSYFDATQKESINAAFTRNLTIIQGPPGTGKTTVSVEIVRGLLGLREYLKGPIFIICYTNHALDQFLEKIMNYTKNIVRLGGRCKVESLKKFQLDSCKNAPNFPQRKEVRKLVWLRRTMDEAMDSLRGVYNQMGSCQILGVPFDELYKAKLQVKKKLKEALKKEDTIVDDLVYVQEERKEYYSDGEGFGGGYQTFIETVLTERLSLFSYKKAWECFEMDNLEGAYRESLKGFSKKIRDSLERVAFENYMRIRTQGLSDFSLGILNALGLIDFEDIQRDLEDMVKARTAKSRNPEADEEDELRAIAERQLYEQTNNLVDRRAGIIDKEKSCEVFLNSQPLTRKLGSFKNNRELIDAERKKYTDFDTAEENMEAVLASFDGRKQNFRKLKKEHRWVVAEGLIRGLLKKMEDQLNALATLGSAMREGVRNVDNECLAEYLNTRDIIGVTTTGAAKQIDMLRQIGSKVTVIEEAAEVLEAQIVTSLTESVQHLILIGDHLQLRPKVNDMHLANYYRLEISLYERLMSLGFPHVQLRTQRRMRPEISEVIRLYYPFLEDGSNVFGRPDILHMPANIFFFTHRWPEAADGEQKTSKKNPREAMMVIRFVEYLLQIGYRHDDIVVLSLYAGQLLHINTEFAKRKRSKNEPTIRVCTIDDYQGEECRIVVLSLVRSNPENKIGFLRVNNRINVALSRARDGLFIFGDALCIRKYYEKTKNNVPDLLLYKALVLLSERGRVSDQLTLSCQAHKTETVVKQPEDFDRLRQHFCKRKCDVRALCGHGCDRPCHTYEITKNNPTGHENNKCKKECIRVHDCGHSCGKKCFDCSCEVFRCRVQLTIDLPYCDHQKQIDCNDRAAPNRFDCFQPCKRRLECGHPCQKCCGDPCEEMRQVSISKKVTDWGGFQRACKELVEFVRPCSHPHSKPCGMVLDLFLVKEACPGKCLVTQPCGHICRRACHYNTKVGHASAITHSPGDCLEMCQRQHPCGHPCKKVCGTCATSSFGCIQIIKKSLPKCNHLKEMKCYESHHPENLKCIENCERKLPCGHDCKNMCRAACSEFYLEGFKTNQSQPWKGFDMPCKELVNFKRVCGHVVLKMCGMKGGFFNETTTCTQQCGNRLDCGHLCSQNCHYISGFFGGKISHDRFSCTAQCERKHSCGHSCRKRCGQCASEPFICHQPVAVQQPNCTHTKIVPCHQKDHLESKQCIEDCTRTLACGHACAKKCRMRCVDFAVEFNVAPFHSFWKGYQEACRVLKPVRRPCGHQATQSCGMKIDYFLLNFRCPGKCDVPADCGHACPLPCHYDSQNPKRPVTHNPKVCREICRRQHPCGHPCKKVCGVCHSEPFRCYQEVLVSLPNCNHKKKILCCKVSDKDQYFCIEKCERTLKCGHKCMKNCKEDCEEIGVNFAKKWPARLVGMFETSCEFEVSYTRICGHSSVRPCGANPLLHAANNLCISKCGGVRQCRHLCQRECHACRKIVHGEMVENHGVCPSRCSKQLLCGHRCTSACHPETECPKCDEQVSPALNPLSATAQNNRIVNSLFGSNTNLASVPCFGVVDHQIIREKLNPCIGLRLNQGLISWELSCGDFLELASPSRPYSVDLQKRTVDRCPKLECPFNDVGLQPSNKTPDHFIQLHLHAKALIDQRAKQLGWILQPTFNHDGQAFMARNEAFENIPGFLMRSIPLKFSSFSGKAPGEQRFDNRLLFLGRLLSHFISILTLANYKFARDTIELLRAQVSEFLTPTQEFVGQVVRGLRLVKALVWFTKLQFALDSVSLGTKMSSFLSIFSKSSLSILQGLHAKCLSLRLNLDSETYKRLAKAEINAQIEQKVFVKHSEELFLFVFPEKLPGFNVNAWKTCPQGHFIASQLWGVSLAETPCNSCVLEGAANQGASQTIGPSSKPLLQISKERVVSVDLRILETEDDWAQLSRLLSIHRD